MITEQFLRLMWHMINQIVSKVEYDLYVVEDEYATEELFDGAFVSPVVMASISPWREGIDRILPVHCFKSG